VWVFARPLSGTRFWKRLADTSAGTFHLCHWAVLVSEKERNDVTLITARHESVYPWENEIALGRMYELERDGDSNTLNVVDDFGTTQLDQEWLTLSAQFVGVSRMPNDEIVGRGDSLFTYPDYSGDDN
jgi:hypothetical protein